MKLFLRLNYDKARKLEFYSLYYGVINVGEKYDLEALHLDIMLNRLKAAVPEMEKLRVPELKKPLTPELREARNAQEVCAAGIMGQVRGLSKTEVDAYVQAAKIFLPYAKNHLCNFSRLNLIEQKTLVSQFLSGIQIDSNLKSAATTLGLDVSLVKMKQVHENFCSVYENKRQSQSRLEKIETNKIRKDLSGFMREFFQAVEVAVIQYPELDYQPLINEMNQEIIRYKSLINLRDGQTTETTEAAQTTEKVQAV